MGYRGGFYEKGPEACLVSDGASAIQLQDGPTTAKAEPFSNGGSTCGITEFKRNGGMHRSNCNQEREEWEYVGESHEEGGEEVHQVLELRRNQQKQRVNWPTEHSLFPCAIGVEEVKKMASEVEPGKKGGVEGRCFKISFLVLMTLFLFDW